MDIILNQIAIWRPCGSTKLNKRLSPAGQSYKTAGSPVYQKSETGLIRYCKDYETGDIQYCLFFRTAVENDTLAEQVLDDIAKKITKEYALKATAKSTSMDFEYTPYTFNPTEINQEDK